MPRFGYKQKIIPHPDPSEDYVRGQADHACGKGIFAQPFDERTMRGRDWLRGWRDAYRASQLPTD